MRTSVPVLVSVVLLASAAAAQSLPASFVALLPAGASLDKSSSGWAVIENSVTGGLEAKFPGPRNCFRLQSELSLHLTGNSDFAALPDMVKQMAADELRTAKGGLAEEAKNRGSKSGVGSLDVVGVGPTKEEQLPNGQILYYEYTENCANRQNATVASLRGQALKGTTMLTFRLLMNSGIAEARAKAVEMFDKFAKLDVEGAKKGR